MSPLQMERPIRLDMLFELSTPVGRQVEADQSHLTECGVVGIHHADILVRQFRANLVPDVICRNRRAPDFIEKRGERFRSPFQQPLVVLGLACEECAEKSTCQRSNSHSNSVPNKIYHRAAAQRPSSVAAMERSGIAVKCSALLCALLGNISNTIFCLNAFVYEARIVGKDCFWLFFEADNGI